MPRSTRPQVRKVFDNIKKRSLNKAQREMVRGLPGAVTQLRDHIGEVMGQYGLGHMTGNTINSCGAAIYRDGKFQAIVTTSDIEGREPIHVTLADGDVYEAGRPRYDGTLQASRFEADEGEHHFYANEKVFQFLRRYPPTRREGISYRFVMYLEYNQRIGQEAMLLMMDDVESRGGQISAFKLEGRGWKKLITTR